MANYKEIEKLRTTTRHYVKYDYNKIDKAYLDTFGFNPSMRYCRYLITGNNSQVKKYDVIKNNFLTHDYKLKNIYIKDFKRIEDKLKDNLYPKSTYQVSIKKYYEAVLSHFVNITTINNNKENLAVKNMLFCCASIDFDAVIKDLDKACQDEKEMIKVLKSLYYEVNAAALNGIFARLFMITNNAGKNKGDITKADPFIEQLITNLYNKTMFGDANNKPLQIPTYPQTDFPLLTFLNNRLDATKYLRNLSSDEIITRIVNPVSAVFTRALENQKDKEVSK